MRLVVTADDKSETAFDLAVAAMGDARLVLTDDLIRAALRREKAALKEAKRRPGAGAKPKPERKPKTNVQRKAAARGAAEKPLGPDEGDPNGR